MMTDAIINGKQSIILPKSAIDLMEHKRKLYIEKQKEWNTLVKKKAKAREYDKSGNLEKAATAYKELIEFAVASPNLTMTNYGHDVNRLRIVLNKLKRKEEYQSFIEEHNITIP
jgi:hypothetical protein